MPSVRSAGCCTFICCSHTWKRAVRLVAHRSRDHNRVLNPTLRACELFDYASHTYATRVPAVGARIAVGAMNLYPATPLETFVDMLLVSAELAGYAIRKRMNEKPVMQALFRGVSAKRQPKG